MKKNLNVRQERFCEFIAAGETQTAAYIKAGFKVNKSVARRNAARLLTNADIKFRIEKLRAPQSAAAALTRDRKRAILCRIAEDETKSLDARLRAIAEDNKMAGHYEPDQHVIGTGSKTLESIEERAKRVAAVLSIA